ncbi:hypothetical protein CRD60_05470 [Bifidobacterium aemilianum]|uniref:Putative manganese efflux pump MntP n=1 Tax=Bifidobacterium aemilianum TaxID=2493120 RepID=A0A366K7P3_9BIFI|nr:manganese efflux pump MntP family protein [Bifidobacterium aemilianum]RBP97684.1 hypothetical protein CRD60_05470 [Bifidobacterium aemilianum]
MIIEILLISLSVSMDAFAVAIGKGLTVKRVRAQDALKTAIWFGGLQALFPLLGFFLASRFNQYLDQVDHWIIFILLALIGGNMIREAFGEDQENLKETAKFDWRHMLPLAVACSIDAFAIGVSLAFMDVNVIFAIATIGLVTGVLSAAGLYMGRFVGARWQTPAQIAGGLMLIFIGLKVLLEHLGFIAW